MRCRQRAQLLRGAPERTIRTPRTPGGTSETLLVEIASKLSEQQANEHSHFQKRRVLQLMLEDADPEETGCLDRATFREVVVCMNIKPSPCAFNDLFKKYSVRNSYGELLLKYAEIPHDMIAAEERQKVNQTSLVLPAELRDSKGTDSAPSKKNSSKRVC